jgi:hypothetical protein
MSRLLAIIGVIIVFALQALATTQGTSATHVELRPVDQGLTDPALVGAIDIHTHLDPDSTGGGQVARAIDAIEAAKMAKARGMRGFVIKNHLDAGAAASAYFARKAVPGVEVYGRMALNLPTGGINPSAVIHFTEIKGGWGRIIEMPTRDAENAIVRAREENRPWVLLGPPEAPKYVSTVRHGQLLPEVKSLIAMIAKLRTVDSNGQVALATGHATAEEHALIAREARAQRVQVVLTHPDNVVPPAQLEELAKIGAFIEVNASRGFSPGISIEAWLRESIDTIRRVGAESIIIASDMGQLSTAPRGSTPRPLPGDGLALAAKALRAKGVTERELSLMMKENPARLLGLPRSASSGSD